MMRSHYSGEVIGFLLPCISANTARTCRCIVCSRSLCVCRACAASMDKEAPVELVRVERCAFAVLRRPCSDATNA